jgi:signal transduction histidine kinase
MRRLYLQVYLTIVGSLILVVLTAGLVWHFVADVPPFNRPFQLAGEVAAEFVPPAGAPREVQQRAVAQLAARLGTDVALFSATGEQLAAVGRPLPFPGRGRSVGFGGWLRGPSGSALSIRLPDQRWLVAGVPERHRPPGFALIAFLGAIALVVGLAALPVVRRVTRRLERLQRGVESLGAGDLGARVKVEGRDEVARLAQSFNNAAARIEGLVGAHRMLLANASHELRTPLTRIRLGLELAAVEPGRKAELERDIAELDQLVEEILLASRLDATDKLNVDEATDLVALAAEECAHYPDCSLDGEAVTVRGDPTLLRRMIRNLLENAQRHGKPPITVRVTRQGGSAELAVADHGAVIPDAERERLFAPFYRAPGTSGGQGTGLGLALVRQIARRHHGDVAYTPGQGSCFTVTLPAANL